MDFINLNEDLIVNVSSGKKKSIWAFKMVQPKRGAVSAGQNVSKPSCWACLVVRPVCCAEPKQFF